MVDAGSIGCRDGYRTKAALGRDASYDYRMAVGLGGTDPVRIALGTAAVASVAHLDGAGASTFMVTGPAMLPLYQRAAMSPLSLTCITALAAGTMNMLPWGGPTTRAATALIDQADMSCITRRLRSRK